MVEAVGLLLFTLFAGTFLGIFVLKPYASLIQKRAQAVYFSVLILLFFAVNAGALYLSLGAPLMVAPIAIYHDISKE